MNLKVVVEWSGNDQFDKRSEVINNVDVLHMEGNYLNVNYHKDGKYLTKEFHNALCEKVTITQEDR